MTTHHDVIEALCNLVHESWMANQRERGVASAQSRNNTGELMVPYAALAEVDKDDDRRVVCTVLLGLAGRPITEVLGLLRDLNDDVLLSHLRAAAKLCDPIPSDLAGRCAEAAAGEDGQP